MIRNAASLLPLLLLAACSAAPSDGESDRENETATEAPFSSDQATLLDFDFDGELVTDSAWGTDKSVIQDQLLYTMGHLNFDKSVGRLDKVTLSAVERITEEGGRTRIKYHAKLPVAWGSKTRLPTSYAFRLPKDISFGALETFTETYNHACVDSGAHDVDTGSMWYYYRPQRSGCSIDAATAPTFAATVTVSTENTTRKYPEYQKVWEDNTLNVVAIFGKYEDGATTGDAGISAFNSFVASMRRELSGATTTPATVPTTPGVETPDVSFTKTLPDGKVVNVTALLVDNVGSTSAAFDARYNALSTRADLIAYNGHAGLGQNVRALARKGSFVAGQYQIIFMNGCDTFSYVDGALAQTRARLNPDDPTGTKYMEFVTNAMPAYFVSMSNASTTLIRGLLAFQTPKTYDQMFSSVDRSQVIVVTGEEDNVFTPGMQIGEGPVPPPIPPGGFSFALTGSPKRNEEVRASAGVLEAGVYTFAMTGTGDADLYVKSGAQATSRTWDCRPYKNGSAESCTVTLAAPAEVSVLVRGYAAASSFTIAGTKQ